MVNSFSKEMLFYAVGDVAPSRKNPASIFKDVTHTLSRADVAFCQLEINISERGTRLPQARHTTRANLKTARAIRDAGFRVVSFAGNHCMDWGQEAFFDTIDALKREGVSVIGVGKNIEEARKPLILESKGNRVAFLAYNTILPTGYWAEANRPGCAPMRAWTLYEQIEHDQPGTPCRIHTFPHREDLEAMAEDIKKAKTQADVVILSMHWGIHFIPAILATYQRDMAHVAIDSGADLILGHHAHILKGIEVYKGRVIFYSLCNFAVDLPFTKEHAESKSFKEIQRLNPDWIPDFDCLYNFPTDSQKTIVVKCIISNGAIKGVFFLPTYVNKKTAQPEILTSKDKRFVEVVRYMEEVTRVEGIDTKYNIHGDEVVLI